MVKIHLFELGRAVLNNPFSPAQEKDGDLFALANRNYPANSPFGLACLFDVVTHAEAFGYLIELADLLRRTAFEPVCDG